MNPLTDHRGRPLRTMEFRSGHPKLAVLYPGLNYTLKAPLFFYLSEWFEQEGWDLVGVDYRYHEDPEFAAADGAEKDRWFQADSLAVGRWVSELLPSYPQTALVSKSLGTSMLYHQVQAGLVPPSTALVWLTPGTIAPDLFGRLASYPHSSLVAAGTADKHYQKGEPGRLAGLPRVRVLEVAGAGHVFEAPGDVRQSIENLATVVGAVADFLGRGTPWGS